MKKLLIILSVGLLSLNSCALLFNGTKQSIQVHSLTPDSKIYIDGSLKGKEVITAEVRRNTNHTVIVKKEGCKTEHIQLIKHAQIGWVIYAVIFNQFALLTDAITGAWNAFDNSNISVELDCSNK